MASLLETGNRTQPEVIVRNELPGGLPLSEIVEQARRNVVWLTDEQLQANWEKDDENPSSTPTSIGAVATSPAEFAYQGGNGGDVSFVPVKFVRGYN